MGDQLTDRPQAKGEQSKKSNANVNHHKTVKHTALHRTQNSTSQMIQFMKLDKLAVTPSHVGRDSSASANVFPCVAPTKSYVAI